MMGSYAPCGSDPGRRNRADPVSGRRGRRFLFGTVDLAIADGAGVKNLAVTGYGQAPHSLILFCEPVKKLV